MTQRERERIEHRIAVARRRLGRGIDTRVEKRGEVLESNIVVRLEAVLRYADRGGL